MHYRLNVAKISAEQGEIRTNGPETPDPVGFETAEGLHAALLEEEMASKAAKAAEIEYRRLESTADKLDAAFAPLLGREFPFRTRDVFYDHTHSSRGVDWAHQLETEDEMEVQGKFQGFMILDTRDVNDLSEGTLQRYRICVDLSPYSDEQSPLFKFIPLTEELMKQLLELLPSQEQGVEG